MAKRNRREKNKAKKERQNKKLIETVKLEQAAAIEEIPYYDRMELCPECDRRIHVWETGYATQAEPCCLAKANKMLKERDNELQSNDVRWKG